MYVGDDGSCSLPLPSLGAGGISSGGISLSSVVVRPGIRNGGSREAS